MTTAGPSRIRRLEESVINRIAAGEVREPSHMLSLLPPRGAGDTATSECSQRNDRE